MDELDQKKAYMDQSVKTSFIYCNLCSSVSDLVGQERIILFLLGLDALVEANSFFVFLGNGVKMIVYG